MLQQKCNTVVCNGPCQPHLFPLHVVCSLHTSSSSSDVSYPAAPAPPSSMPFPGGGAPPKPWLSRNASSAPSASPGCLRFRLTASGAAAGSAA